MNRRHFLKSAFYAASIVAATRARSALAYRPLTSSDGGNGKCKSKKRCKQRRR